jgi:hypothetical protein
MISARPIARWSLASSLAVITVAGSMAICAPAANASPSKSNCFGAPAIFATTTADCAQQAQAQLAAMLQALADGNTDEADVALQTLQTLLAAAGASDSDLELITAETKAQTNAKQFLRDFLANVEADVLGNTLQNYCDQTAAKGTSKQVGTRLSPLCRFLGLAVGQP